MGEIIDMIWKLPWYQVLVVAIADDIILFLKLWPAWIVFGIITIIVGFVLRDD